PQPAAREHAHGAVDAVARSDAKLQRRLASDLVGQVLGAVVRGDDHRDAVGLRGGSHVDDRAEATVLGPLATDCYKPEKCRWDATGLQRLECSAWIPHSGWQASGSHTSALRRTSSRMKRRRPTCRCARSWRALWSPPSRSPCLKARTPGATFASLRS